MFGSEYSSHATHHCEKHEVKIGFEKMSHYYAVEKSENYSHMDSKKVSEKDAPQLKGKGIVKALGIFQHSDIGILADKLYKEY